MMIRPRFIASPLWRIGWRYLFRHPWQSALLVVGIMLGVAVVVSIDIANTSASRAFDLSTEVVTGKATHQIVGGPTGIDETVYTQLRRAGQLELATPVISEYVSSPQLGSITMQLLGVDAFTEAPFRDYFGSQPGEETSSPVLIGDLSTFLTQPGAVLISADVAERFGLTVCSKVSSDCQISLIISGRQHSAYITGLIQPSDSISRRALQNVILVDIATAQELTGRIGKLDWIDVILSENCQLPQPQLTHGCPESIQKNLPPGVTIQPVEARSGTIEQMTRAFRLNLTALSLLALLVGLFLIYNTMTFSVVQRRSLFGSLRCLGVTRHEVFALIAIEALIVGVVGSALGLLLGVFMGQGAIRLVTQTINDLFFVVSVRGIQIPAISLVKGAVLGILSTLITAAPPAWEAASTSPRSAMSRSGIESKARRAVVLAALAGIAVCLTGIGLLVFPSRDLTVSFTGTFAVIVGFSMLAPVATIVFMRLVTTPLGMTLGSLGRMAPRNVVNSISRTAIAIAALMVAVSVTIGVSVMVSSFRYTVVEWLEQTLSGDIYISPPGVSTTQSTVTIDDEIIQKLDDWPGVTQVLMLRSVNINSPAGLIHIAASNNPAVSDERSFLTSKGSKEFIRQGIQSGGIILSEPLANRLGLSDSTTSLILNTDNGPKEFPILGIYYDYSSVQGTVLMSLDVYQKLWKDDTITAIALKLEPGIDPEMITQDLKSALSPLQPLIIRPNALLRAEVLEVFDRTFAITSAMQLLATIVAFIGVLSALLSVELERQRELGILRSVGMTIRQLWGLLLLETGLIGATAGLLAMPGGLVLATILIYIINRRSFGWTLQMDLVPQPFIQALIIAIAAALLAGIYPAIRLGKIATANAIRSE